MTIKLITWLVASVYFTSAVFRSLLCFEVSPKITSLLWNEELVTPFLENYGLSYTEYLNSDLLQSVLTHTGDYFGVVLILSALVSLILYLNPFVRVGGKLVIVAFSALTFAHLFNIAILNYFSKDERIVEILELAIQWGSPLVFILFVYGKLKLGFRLISILAGFTFLGHGVYAFGWPYAVPSHFTDMVIDFFGASEQFSAVFLKMIGVLDFVIAGCYFFNIRSRYILGWAIIWGCATTFARIGVVGDFSSLYSVYIWSLESLVRLGHIIFPLVIYLYHFKLNINDIEKSEANLKKA